MRHPVCTGYESVRLRDTGKHRTHRHCGPQFVAHACCLRFVHGWLVVSDVMAEMLFGMV